MPPSVNREASEPADHAAVAFHPPILLFAAIGAGFLLRWLLPLTFLPRQASRIAGPTITAAAFGLFFWSVYSMHKGGGSIPTEQPTETIVVRGPYRFSRNPIYLGMVLLQIGIGIWANTLWLLGLAALSAALLWWGVISREEAYLERKFRTDYTDYKVKVRRWI